MQGKQSENEREPMFDKLLCMHEAGHATEAIASGYAVRAWVTNDAGVVDGGRRTPVNCVAGPVGQWIEVIDMIDFKAWIEYWQKHGDKSMGFTESDIPPTDDWDKKEAWALESYETLKANREQFDEITTVLMQTGAWESPDYVSIGDPDDEYRQFLELARFQKAQRKKG